MEEQGNQSRHRFTCYDTLHTTYYVVQQKRDVEVIAMCFSGGPCTDGSKLLQEMRPDYARRDGEELTDSYDWKGCPDDLPNGTVALGLTPMVRHCFILPSMPACVFASPHMPISHSKQTHSSLLIKLNESSEGFA